MMKYCLITFILSIFIFSQPQWTHFQQNNEYGSFTNVRDISFDNNEIYMAMVHGFQYFNAAGLNIVNSNDKKLENNWYYNSSAWVSRGIAKDQNGTIWVATADGVMRVKDQNIVRLDTSLQPGLGMDKAYQDVTINKNGVVWLAGPVNSGLTYIENDNLITVTVDDWRLGPDLNGTNIEVDDDNNKWFRSYKNIIKYDNSSFTSYSYEGFEFDVNVNFIDIAIFENQIVALVDTSESTFGVSSFLVKLEGNKFVNYELSLNSLGDESNKIKEIEYDSKGRLYLVPQYTTNKKIYRVDENDNIEIINQGTDDPSFFVRSMNIDQLDRLWIGTTQNGVLVYNENVSSVKEKLEEITVFPNPTANTINFNSRFIGKKVTILNSSGKKVLDQNLNSESLNVSSFSNGKYVLIIHEGLSPKWQSEFVVNR